MRPNLNLVAVILAALFAAICSHLGYVGQDTLLTPAELSALSAQPGSQRVVAYALMAGLALTLLWKCRAGPRPHLTTFTWLLCYLGYCGISLGWSQALWHSGSRYLGLLAYCGLALGLALCFSWKELWQIFLRSCELTLLGIWIVELVVLMQTQDIPSRLSGPFHPNLAGALCSTLVILLFPKRTENWTSQLALGFCGLSLLVTGSRAALAACLLGLLVQYLFQSRSGSSLNWRQGLALGALGAGSLSLGLFWRYVPGRPLGGRLQLWNLLTNSVAEQPFLGYGYEGYFLPQHIEKIWQQLYWVAPSAHSWALEALLGTGAIGLALALGTLVSGALALRLEEKSECRRALALLLMAAALSSVESTYLKPYSLYGLLTLTLLLKAGSGHLTPLLRASQHSQLQLLATSTLAVCLLANHGNLYYSLFSSRALSLGTLSAQLQSGTSNKYLAYIGLTLLGLLLFTVNSGRARGFVPARIHVLAPPLLLAACSLLWSTDLRLGLRRIALLGILSLVALSLNRVFTGEQRLRIFRDVGMALSGTGLFVELVLGSFQPQHPGYRFCGVFHPNHQAMALVVVLISSAVLARQNPQSRQLPFLIPTSILLALTGSRFSIFALLCVLSLMLLVRSPSPRVTRYLPYFGVGTFCGLALFLTLRAPHLNGRGPLWKLVAEDILKRPLLGWGYGSYWNPETVAKFSQELGWTVPHAHSGYLDLLLSLGLLGGCLTALWLSKRLGDSLSQLQSLQGAALFATLGYLLVSSFTESWAVLPSNLLGLFTLSWLFSKNEGRTLERKRLGIEFFTTALLTLALLLAFALRLPNS